MKKMKSYFETGLFVNKENLLTLLEILQKKFDKIFITLDGIEYDSSEMTPEEFKKNSFGVSERITAFKITCTLYRSVRGKYYHTYFNIDYDMNHRNSFVNVYISSEEESIFNYLAMSIEKWLKVNKHFDLISKFSNSYFSIPFFYFVSNVCMTIAINELNISDIFSKLTFQYLFPLLLSIGIRKGLKSLFPACEIDIGKNVAKINRKKWSWLISTILIPIALMIISLVYSHN